MKLARNLSAGLASTVASAIVGLAVIPFYIRNLGIEAYGLIGIFATLQALFQVLDFGMGATINREVARQPLGNTSRETRSLLHSVAIVYWAIALSIGLLVFVFADQISMQWQSSSRLSRESITSAVRLIGAVIACRFPISLYQSTLIGSQSILQSSALALGLSVVGNIGAVFVIAHLSPTIEAFFCWQAATGLAFALVARACAWNALGGKAATSFNLKLLLPVARFSGAMIALTMAGLIFSQLDKIILSRMLNLQDFGKYALAALVAGSLTLLIGPVYNIIFPRFSAMVAADEIQEATRLYGLATRFLSTLLFPLAMVLGVFGKDIIELWTKNPALAAEVAPIVTLLAIGNALHGTMYVPHALQLAFGKVRIPIAINTVLMVLVAPLMVLFVIKYGPIGGAVAWLVLHICYVALCTYLTHRYVLPKASAWRWLSREILGPLLLTAGFSGLAVTGMQAVTTTLSERMSVCALLYAATVLSLIATAPELRRRLSTRLASTNVSSRAEP